MFRNKLVSTTLLVAGFLPLTASNQTVPETQLDALLKLAPAVNAPALETALTALHRLEATGARVRSDALLLIDYSKPSTEPRLWVFDLAHGRLLFQELVAHGRNSGANYASHFSNAPNSLMSSLGVFLTGDTYIGKHGLSLRLEGMEKGINDNSMERGIVMHSADYVSSVLADREGRLGRSWGCPAVRPAIAHKLIEAVKGGVLMLAYYPEKAWLRASALAGPAPHAS